MSISIVLADDHAIVRDGLRALLEAEPGFAVAGEADDGLKAIRLVERLKPDVLVLDLMMPGLNGLDALRIVGQRSPRTRVVVLSMSDSETFVAQALKGGASAYVLKGCKAGCLMEAVRRVVDGQSYLSPPLSDRPLEAYLEKAEAASPDPHDTLTPRERQVFQLAAEGKANTEIAARLHLSSRTVEMHRASMMRKLGLPNHAELVRYAMKRGLLPAEQ